MKQYKDPSHDDLHVERVFKLAMIIANDEIRKGTEINLQIVQLAALFHDIADHKYIKAGTPKNLDADGNECPQALNAFFTSFSSILHQSTAKTICKIIQNVSYSKEMKRRGHGETSWHTQCKELHWYDIITNKAA